MPPSILNHTFSATGVRKSATEEQLPGSEFTAAIKAGAVSAAAAPFTAANTSLAQNDTMYNMPYNPLSTYGSMYGGGYGGMLGPSMFGASPPYSMMTGPLSGLNQFLFSVQSVIFSLGQAVQIVSMNTQALQQLLESATSMFDHTIATWHEMQRLEARCREFETEEEKKRRRRLRALRWALVTAATYAGYKLIRRIVTRERPRRLMSEAIPYRPPGSHDATPHYQYSSMYRGQSQSPYGPSGSYGYY